jgi:hypothetical protein
MQSVDISVQGELQCCFGDEVRSLFSCHFRRALLLLRVRPRRTRGRP